LATSGRHSLVRSDLHGTSGAAGDLWPSGEIRQDFHPAECSGQGGDELRHEGPRPRSSRSFNAARVDANYGLIGGNKSAPGPGRAWPLRTTTCLRWPGPTTVVWATTPTPHDSSHRPDGPTACRCEETTGMEAEWSPFKAAFSGTRPGRTNRCFCTSEADAQVFDVGRDVIAQFHQKAGKHSRPVASSSTRGRWSVEAQAPEKVRPERRKPRGRQRAHEDRRLPERAVVVWRTKTRADPVAPATASRRPGGERSRKDLLLRRPVVLRLEPKGGRPAVPSLRASVGRIRSILGALLQSPRRVLCRAGQRIGKTQTGNSSRANRAVDRESSCGCPDS